MNTSSRRDADLGSDHLEVTSGGRVAASRGLGDGPVLHRGRRIHGGHPGPAEPGCQALRLRSAAPHGRPSARSRAGGPRRGRPRPAPSSRRCGRSTTRLSRHCRWCRTAAVRADPGRTRAASSPSRWDPARAAGRPTARPARPVRRRRAAPTRRRRRRVTPRPPRRRRGRGGPWSPCCRATTGCRRWCRGRRWQPTPDQLGVAGLLGQRVGTSPSQRAGTVQVGRDMRQ